MQQVPPSMFPLSEEDLKLRWLTRSRWCVACGVSSAFAFSKYAMGLTLSWAPLLLFLTVLCASGSALYVRRLPPSKTLIAGVLFVDILCFTALLHQYGGSTNPLSSVYFLYVIVGSLLLPAYGAWLLATLCSLSFGILFFSHIPIPELAVDHAHHGAFSTHLLGMLITFVCTSLMLVYFISRLAGALRGREAELAVLRDRTAHTQRLAAVTTLAAGAAHELRTPLATIAVSIGEIDREIQSIPITGELKCECESITRAVTRCQSIITQLCSDAGVVSGEPAVMTSVLSIIEVLLRHLSTPELCSVTIPAEVANFQTRTFQSGLVQALLSLVKNGLEYGPVELSVEREAGMLRFIIRDRGPGIAPSIHSRLGEPFFTTKKQGNGMGLGIFISKTFAERLGGEVTFQSSFPCGTAAIITIPELI